MSSECEYVFDSLAPGAKLEYNQSHTVVSQPVTLIVMAKGRKTPSSSGDKAMMKHPQAVFTKVSVQVRSRFC